ncbi:MAG: hypothetical protein JW938_06515 [Candidatus Omnitrophica bacterium]|nr:hypothetical protein [Candidatus Omnitrophota bacterium]
MKKQICVVVILLMICGCVMNKKEVTVESLQDRRIKGGYTKIYSASYDEAFQAVLDVCPELELVVEADDKEGNVIILWGDMDEKIDEELIGVYFDPYHEQRTSIRIVTPCMKYKPRDWDDYDKADPWGLNIHTALKKRLG